MMNREQKNKYHREWSKNNREKKDAANEKWIKNNPEKRARIYKKHHLKRLYSLAIEDYDKMMAIQNNLCAICQQPETVLRNGKPANLSVDHNHNTGKIRELLCNRCNRVIGLLNDNKELCIKMAGYLEKHNDDTPTTLQEDK